MEPIPEVAPPTPAPTPAHQSVVVPLIVVVCFGALVSAQARLNGELGQRMGSAFGGALVNFSVGFLVLLPIVLWQRIPLRGLRARTKWWFWVGGFGGAIGQWTLVSAAPKIGVALLSVGFASGMSVGGLLADRIGLGIFGRHRIGGARLVGALLAMAAVAVAASGRMDAAGSMGYLVWAVAGGFLTAGQQPVNGRLAHAAGTPLFGAIVSFAAGILFLAVLLAIQHPSLTFPSEPWLYCGGIFAASFVYTAVRLVGRLGALRLSLATIAGQLAGGIIVDLIVPVEGQRLGIERVIGAVIAFVSVAVAAGTPRAHRVMTPKFETAEAGLPSV